LPGPLEFHGIIFDHAPHFGELQLNDRSLPATKDGLLPTALSAADEPHQTMKLRCTSCHGQTDPSVHMEVGLSTCFLCHFKEGHFNQGTGACTHCHQIPEGRFELGGGITFTHELVYQNGIDCQNCHGGLNHGDGNVSRVRCQVCHNREVDLEKISDTELMHQLHVTEHKVECIDCHGEITHSVRKHELTDAASDCSSCHPNHHREQVNMLQGTGGLSIGEGRAGMTATGVQCLACHRDREISTTGSIVWKASAEVCTACHTDAATEELQAYQDDVQASLTDIKSALQRASNALKVVELAPEQLAESEAVLSRLEHDVDFLRVGNGIHNIHYATTLTNVLFDDTAALCRTLDVAGPTITLPANAYEIDEASTNRE
jgi:predicted CXXCH cytochrome family protein